MAKRLRKKRSAAGRRRRVVLLTRWMMILDEVMRLEVDVIDSGDAFTASQLQVMEHSLDQLWHHLTWSRPRFPPLPPRVK